MLSGGQVATGAAFACPVLIASGLAIGGYHNRPLAVACFVLAGFVVAGACAYVPIQKWINRRRGLVPITAQHTLIGTGAILRLDTGTEPSIDDVYCEVHIPHYLYVGGQSRGTAKRRHPGVPERVTTFVFPDDFGLAPIFKQGKCLGWYGVQWVIDQHGAKRVVSDKFHIKNVSVLASLRLASENRGPNVSRFALYSSWVLAPLFSRRLLGRFSWAERLWKRIYAKALAD